MKGCEGVRWSEAGAKYQLGRECPSRLFVPDSCPFEGAVRTVSRMACDVEQSSLAV